MIQNFLLATYYDNGYRQALLDVKNWFACHSMSLKRDKMYNQKGVQQILSAMVDNADYMYEKAEEMDLYFNKIQKKLVTWKGKEK